MNCFQRALRHAAVIGCTIALCFSAGWAKDAPLPRENSFSAPRHQMISVKMVGPADEAADLQIICILKHAAAGDPYIEAMDALNKKLGGLISNLRDHDEFAGDAGETLLLTPPPGSIAARQLLLIGVGPERELSLDMLKRVGRIAAREAVRIHAAHVAFAPTLRDQGSMRIDVAEGGSAVVEQWVLAYDTEKRLAEEKLAPAADVESFTIEAGPKYFDAVSKAADAAIEGATAQLGKRSERKP